jgi:type I restriction enzyme S subunit
VTISPNELYREIGIRSHGKGIFHKEPVTGESLGSKRVFSVVPESLVFNIVFAWEGAVAVTSKDEAGMIGSHRFPMFMPSEPQAVDVEFLRRFFQTKLGIQLLGDASPGGAGRNRTLSQKATAETPIPLPPLPEQRKIAAILSSVDEAIAGTQAVIDQLQVVKKAMMADLLTRGIPGRHKKFKKSEIGEMPDSWKISALGEVSEVFNGRAAGTGGTWLRVFKTKHVYDGFLRLTIPEFARDDSATRVPQECYLREGDVLTPNMAHGTIGRVAFVDAVEPRWTVDGQVMVLRATAEVICGRFLFEFMSAHQGRNQLLGLEKGGAFDTLRGQTHIYPRDVRTLRIPVPSLEEQQTICESAASFDAPILVGRERLASLNEIRRGLMDLLLTGEVRVRVDEESAA